MSLLCAKARDGNEIERELAGYQAGKLLYLILIDAPTLVQLLDEEHEENVRDAAHRLAQSAAES